MESLHHPFAAACAPRVARRLSVSWPDALIHAAQNQTLFRREPPSACPGMRTVPLAMSYQNGRRIITVDVATGEVLDLSQPRRDAWFSLAPDGKRLLLTNGRGGFWTSEIAYTNGEGN